MKSQRGDIEVVVSVVLLVVILLFTLIGGWLVREYKCSNYSSMTGMPTQYKLFDGCYVKTEKGWFLKEQLRDIQVK